MGAQFSERFETPAAPRPRATWQLRLEQSGELARRAVDLGVRTVREVRARGLVRPVLMIGGILLVALVAGYFWLTGSALR